MDASAQITLRPWYDRDVESLRHLRNDLETQVMLGALAKPNCDKQVMDWLERHSADPAGAFFVVAVPPSDQAVGFVELKSLHLVHRHAWVGIGVHQDHRRRGVGRLALSRLERFAGDMFGIRKLLAEVLVSNDGSLRLFRSLGYADVGVLREHLYHGGGYQDVNVLEKIVG